MLSGMSGGTPRNYILYHECAHGFIPFAGRFINLNRMAEAEGLDYHYLWRIFNGQRQPSLRYATRIAECLAMTQIEFLIQLASCHNADSGATA